MGLFNRTKSKLKKKLQNLSIEEWEDLLIESGIHYSLAAKIIKTLSRTLNTSLQEEGIRKNLSAQIESLLLKPPSETILDTPLKIVLFVGINGVGKTTTLAKYARYLLTNHKLQTQDICVAAGDCFRAAAIEQLRVHCQKLNVDLIAKERGSDPSAVVYDALSHAQSSSKRVLLIDTAGRMNTREDLMRQIEKIHRICLARAEGTTLENLIVLDANTGSNALSQVESFSAMLPLHAHIMTKFDGGSKAGTIVSIADTFSLPCAYLGLGESLDDFIPFSSEYFMREFF